MDSGTCSYGLDVEGSDCFETVSRSLNGPPRDCFRIVSILFRERLEMLLGGTH